MLPFYDVTELAEFEIRNSWKPPPVQYSATSFQGCQTFLRDYYNILCPYLYGEFQQIDLGMEPRHRHNWKDIGNPDGFGSENTYVPEFSTAEIHYSIDCLCTPRLKKVSNNSSFLVSLVGKKPFMAGKSIVNIREVQRKKQQNSRKEHQVVCQVENEEMTGHSQIRTSKFVQYCHICWFGVFDENKHVPFLSRLKLNSISGKYFYINPINAGRSVQLRSSLIVLV